MKNRKVKNQTALEGKLKKSMAKTIQSSEQTSIKEEELRLALEGRS